MSKRSSENLSEPTEKISKHQSLPSENRLKHKSSLREKSKKYEKISQTKILLVIMQSLIILVLFLSSLYLNFKVYRLSPS